jgi:hypothetical protein
MRMRNPVSNCRKRNKEVFSLQKEITEFKKSKEEEILEIQKKHSEEFDKVKELHHDEIQWLQQKLQKIENPKNNISNSGITDASNLNDISGTFSQDMQRITYFKLQEKENADLKTKLSTIESQYKDAIEGYRNKLSKKNKKIKSLEKSLNDMRRSFKTLSDNMKEMNVRTSKLEEVCTSKNTNQFQTRFYADKDLSSESWVLFKTKERYNTPKRLAEHTDVKETNFESIMHTKSTPFDTYKDSHFLSPRQFQNSSENIKIFSSRENFCKDESEEREKECDCDECKNGVVKIRIWKFEAGDAKSNYLTIQKEYIENTPTKLTTNLRDQEDICVKTFQHSKTQSQFQGLRESNVNYIPKELWRLSINNNKKTVASSQFFPSEDKDIFLKSYFRDNFAKSSNLRKSNLIMTKSKNLIESRLFKEIGENEFSRWPSGFGETNGRNDCEVLHSSPQLIRK